MVALAALVRVAFSASAPVFLHGDSYQYYRPALALMNGDGFPLPLKRPPLYPAFMAVVGRGLGEDLRHLAAVQHLLGIGTAALAYGVGRLAIGRGAGLAGGLAAALSGGLLIYERYMLTEALFTFLLTLAVFLYMLGVRRNSAWWCVGSGLALGLATLTRVHAQVLLLLAPVAVALWYRRWCPAVRGTALACLAAAVVLVPWAIRNQVVHGAFTVAGRSGQSLIYRTAIHHPDQFVFYDRANPPEDADPNLERARKYIQAQADAKARNPTANILGLTIHTWLMKNLHLGEAEANDLMRDVALDAIRRSPLTYARLVAEDVPTIFRGAPERLAAHWEAHRRGLADRDNPPPRRLRSLIGPASPEPGPGFALAERLASLYQSAHLGWLVPGLFLVGLLAAAIVPAWRLAWIPGLAVLALHAASVAVVGSSPRYHHPPDPLMHVVAIGGVLLLARWLMALTARLRGWAVQRAAPSGAGLAPR